MRDIFLAKLLNIKKCRRISIRLLLEYNTAQFKINLRLINKKYYLNALKLDSK